MPDTFQLIQDTATDGERLTREREETEHARRLTETAQTGLFSLNQRTPRDTGTDTKVITQD